ncbi:hypothetical protein GLOTRDRAFT_111765 [Gloeophyllum trabeum ATCC 11539]|uniref:Uncharacterized protein n=1 Tax=Gloeophyllum trabeum (strain ATCC 11539 / FP-39264 / Madison 617) TaxID=670483 RepID=S7Q2F6_GLOTA|nr:uncharacterized protein GLOTRDRAFT_111765 [Gloeophyllum trabeum ATCC 11539]EPQ53732.1 hypothetical protein GLOTRDRAFT_111765 [Gloeophyllum trabeum ATCC 11539]
MEGQTVLALLGPTVWTLIREARTVTTTLSCHHSVSKTLTCHQGLNPIVDRCIPKNRLRRGMMHLTDRQSSPDAVHAGTDLLESLRVRVSHLLLLVLTVKIWRVHRRKEGPRIKILNYREPRNQSASADPNPHLSHPRPRRRCPQSARRRPQTRDILATTIEKEDISTCAVIRGTMNDLICSGVEGLC